LRNNIYKKSFYIMKHIRTFESFRNKKNIQEEPVNEEIFGFIGNLFGKLFKSIKRVVNKVKGGNEVEEIYDEYLQKITDALKKQVNVELNLAAAGNPDEAKPAEKPAEKPASPAPKTNEANEAVAKPGVQNPATKPEEGEETKEGEEAGQAQKEPGSDTKLDSKILLQKKELIDQIVMKLKDEAIEKMNGVLSNAGGSEENPGLASLIKNKKSEFELAFLNAKVQFLTDAGDTKMIAQVKKERDAKKAEVEKGYKELSTQIEGGKPTIDLKIGDEYIYTNKEGEKKEVKLISTKSKMKAGPDKEWATKDDESVEDLAGGVAFVAFKNKKGEFDLSSPTVAVLKSKLEVKK
jgi:hypothetical protein